jgi:ribonuclease J
MCRRSLLRDYERKGLRLTRDDAFVHSNWSGYLKEPNGSIVWDKAHEAAAETCMIHTSGHASADELARFANTLAPKTLVPIHGVEWDNPGLQLPTITRLGDGEAWAVP